MSLLRLSHDITEMVGLNCTSLPSYTFITQQAAAASNQQPQHMQREEEAGFVWF